MVREKQTVRRTVGQREMKVRQNRGLVNVTIPVLKIFSWKIRPHEYFLRIFCFGIGFKYFFIFFEHKESA